jgi:hypothetical protein
MRVRPGILLAIFALLALAVPSAHAEWPHFFGRSRGAASPEQWLAHGAEREIRRSDADYRRFRQEATRIEGRMKLSSARFNARTARLQRRYPALAELLHLMQNPRR